MGGNVDDSNIGEWVDARLAKLEPNADCAPDIGRALEQLLERDRRANPHSWTRVWMAVSITVAVCLVIVVLPWRMFRGSLAPANLESQTNPAGSNPSIPERPQAGLKQTTAGGVVVAQTTKPRVIYRVEPQYTDEAREAKIAGTVVLECVIHKDGTLSVTRVVRGLGHGLDDSAESALVQWRFEPGTEDGNPTDVSLNIEINFHIPNEESK